jgi:hypothetical protein
MTVRLSRPAARTRSTSATAAADSVVVNLAPETAGR